MKHEHGEGQKYQETSSSHMVSPLVRLRHDIDQLFQHAYRGFDSLPSLWHHSLTVDQSRAFKPSINIESDSKSYLITMEVPGVDEEAVELDISNDMLVIKGEKTQTTESQETEYHRIERTYGHFERVLCLPEDAKQDEINAEFKNGILTITVPRKAASKAEVRHIDIKRTGTD